MNAAEEVTPVARNKTLPMGFEERSDGQQMYGKPLFFWGIVTATRGPVIGKKAGTRMECSEVYIHTRGQHDKENIFRTTFVGPGDQPGCSRGLFG